jgi:hypothetical protein
MMHFRFPAIVAALTPAAAGPALAQMAMPLPTVQGGVSMTVVKGVTLSELLAAPWAINVHKSTTEGNIYVACGDIVKPK